LAVILYAALEMIHRGALELWPVISVVTGPLIGSVTNAGALRRSAVHPTTTFEPDHWRGGVEPKRLFTIASFAEPLETVTLGWQSRQKHPMSLDLASAHANGPLAGLIQWRG
jgi:hypothetical protein